jgi:DNA-directed RNA polymerase subunit RPC12/RpoP
MTTEEFLTQPVPICFQICPACRQAWLIGSAHENETHRCKDCGYAFVIKPHHSPSAFWAKLKHKTHERIELV